MFVVTMTRGSSWSITPGKVTGISEVYHLAQPKEHEVTASATLCGMGIESYDRITLYRPRGKRICKGCQKSRKTI